MFAVTVEDPDIEPEPQIELKIHPSLLLKVRQFTLLLSSRFKKSDLFSC